MSSKKATQFYKDALHLLNQSKVPYLLGGAFSLRHFTGIHRDTKDLDVFCAPENYIRLIKYFADKGFETEITDARWLAKVFKGEYYVDVIFDTSNNIGRVDKSWFKHAVKGEMLVEPVKFVSAEDLVWCKLYVQSRERYDGADVNHLFLRYGKKLDWKRLLRRVNQHWQLLLAQIINFQFVYPSDRDKVPKWLVDELLLRAKEQYDLPSSEGKICRGPIIDQTQYSTDIKDWNYMAITSKTV